MKPFVDYIFNQFNLARPKFLISITGNTKHGNDKDIEMQESFKKALIKIATNTNAWITTAGTDIGTIKLVGEAIRDDLNGINQTLVGIAAWQRVSFEEKQLIKNKYQGVAGKLSWVRDKYRLI